MFAFLRFKDLLFYHITDTKLYKKETDEDWMNWFINQKYRLSLPIAKDKH